MAEYKLGFYGEEIDLKLRQIEALHKSVTQLEKNDTDINAAIASINNAINELKNASSGAVKHIQRGTVYRSDGNTSDISVTLTGFSDLNKMIVLIDGGVGYAGGNNSTNYYPFGKIDSVTSLTISKGYGFMTAATISYQVIEFY